jgi:hypothetical protein
MDHISVDTAHREHPTPSHLPIPASSGGYLLARPVALPVLPGEAR